MEKGLTSQFTARVTARPAGLRPTFRMAVKSTFIIMGVIISQIRTAIGTLIWLPLAELQGAQRLHAGRQEPAQQHAAPPCRALPTGKGSARRKPTGVWR